MRCCCYISVQASLCSVHPRESRLPAPIRLRALPSAIVFNSHCSRLFDRCACDTAHQRSHARRIICEFLYIRHMENARALRMLQMTHDILCLSKGTFSRSDRTHTLAAFNTQGALGSQSFPRFFSAHFIRSSCGPCSPCKWGLRLKRSFPWLGDFPFASTRGAIYEVETLMSVMLNKPNIN